MVDESEVEVKVSAVTFHYGPEAPAYWVEFFKNTHYDGSADNATKGVTDPTQTGQDATERVQL